MEAQVSILLSATQLHFHHDSLRRLIGEKRLEGSPLGPTAEGFQEPQRYFLAWDVFKLGNFQAKYMTESKRIQWNSKPTSTVCLSERFLFFCTTVNIAEHMSESISRDVFQSAPL